MLLPSAAAAAAAADAADAPTHDDDDLFGSVTMVDDNARAEGYTAGFQEGLHIGNRRTTRVGYTAGKKAGASSNIYIHI